LGWGLLCQEALEGLVKALDFPAGLRMIGRRVLKHDAQALQLQLENDFASLSASEDSGVVTEDRGGQSEPLRS
jgi:hypothetical protein